ncbi:hypothetical protein ACE5JW_10440 [Acinetobacter radioresistens]|jgi:hypothetical protein|uniref:Uncharacterized protein n=2 Tax=Acinetobacter radioresistens TaxID=40216 RepID=A0ABM9YRU1_ACIRA|nr:MULTISPECIES: hypothetical protein [Acinetobacter]EET83829.1 hypothetical protein ACIRA0001_0344 [Acinetobacter radioresistens SK82]ENV85026.1 hypothetical protein F940_02155 [Acinetobacter radioresistens NIPH 2130]EXB87648.1 hypothetical protein J538_0543 [Acinetobacter sp. 272263]EXE58067.1 hypothetical protein J579_1484 [Acinetobacter sp. 1239920]EXF58289.1 hypothetical protein J502_0471 [Acinetobacter sp. 1294596]
MQNYPERRPPNKVLAPLIIAGITTGFLSAAYKFIFKKNSELSHKQNVTENKSEHNSKIKCPEQKHEEF